MFLADFGLSRIISSTGNLVTHTLPAGTAGSVHLLAHDVIAYVTHPYAGGTVTHAPTLCGAAMLAPW